MRRSHDYPNPPPGCTDGTRKYEAHTDPGHGDVCRYESTTDENGVERFPFECPVHCKNSDTMHCVLKSDTNSPCRPNSGIIATNHYRKTSNTPVTQLTYLLRLLTYTTYYSSHTDATVCPTGMLFHHSKGYSIGNAGLAFQEDAGDRCISQQDFDTEPTRATTFQCPSHCDKGSNEDSYKCFYQGSNQLCRLFDGTTTNQSSAYHFQLPPTANYQLLPLQGHCAQKVSTKFDTAQQKATCAEGPTILSVATGSARPTVKDVRYIYIYIYKYIYIHTLPYTLPSRLTSLPPLLPTLLTTYLQPTNY